MVVVDNDVLQLFCLQASASKVVRCLDSVCIYVINQAAFVSYSSGEWEQGFEAHQLAPEGISGTPYLYIALRHSPRYASGELSHSSLKHS